jgi:hypothetical protein
MAPRQKPRTTIIRMAGAAFIRPITKLLSFDIVQLRKSPREAEITSPSRPAYFVFQTC